MSRVFLSLWLCYFSLTVVLSVNDVAKQLTRTILRDYEPSTRPTSTFRDAVNVTMDIGLRELSQLQEADQTLTIKAWVRLSWYDVSLTWNMSKYQGVTRTELSTKNVWLPDIVLFNGAAGNDFYLTDSHSLLVVTYDGHVSWRFPATLVSFCPLDVTYFPFDKQVCHMNFGSWVFSLAQLDLHAVGDTGDASVFKENNEWILEKFPVQRGVTTYNSSEDQYPMLTFSLYLKRRPLYVTFNLVLPSCLIAAIGMLAYILPCDDGEKIGLCVTMLVALSFIMLLMADKMPPTSLSIPLLGEFFAVIVTMLSVTTLLSAFVIHVHFRGGHGKPVPKWVNILVLKGLARILCFDVDCTSKSNAKGVQLNQYINHALSMDGEKKNGNEEKRVDSGVPDSPALHVIGCSLKRIEGALLSRHQAEDERSALEDEWRKVAMVLDRLFLFVYVIICVVAALTLLLKRP